MKGTRRLQTSVVRALESLRAGPGLGLTRFPPFKRIHSLLEVVGDRASSRHRAPLEVDAYGFRFLIDPSDRQVSLSLLLHGTYEPEETTLFERTLCPGMVVVDAGANLGVYTLLAARAVGPTGRVVAFEPDPATFQLLSENVSRNHLSNVDLRNEGLAEESGTMSLYRVPGHPALASLSRSNARSSAVRVDVPVATLDEVLEELGIERVDVMKLDTQGAEIDILRGARETIERARPAMFVEYWPAGLSGMGHDPEDLLAQFEGWSYELSLVTAPDERIERADVVRLSEESGGVDLLLRPQKIGR